MVTVQMYKQGYRDNAIIRDNMVYIFYIRATYFIKWYTSHSV